MDAEEVRQRRDAAQVIAAATQRGAQRGVTERRAADERLSGAVREAFARQRAEELGEDRQFGV
jgi:hypothetical protein